MVNKAASQKRERQLQQFLTNSYKTGGRKCQQITATWKLIQVTRLSSQCPVQGDINWPQFVFLIALIAGLLEAAYSLNWAAQEIWGNCGGETLALL